MQVIEDHRVDISSSDTRFSKKVKEALVGKNVSHHKVELAVKATKGLWTAAKTALESVIPGIEIAASVVETIGSIGSIYFSGRAQEGRTVGKSTAQLFNVNLNAQMLTKLESIQNHGESLALWGGVFNDYGDKGIQDRADLKKFYRAFKKLDLHVRQSENDFVEMNRIFQTFYDSASAYVTTYKSRKDEVERKLADLFVATVLNPMTHWQCKLDHEKDSKVECFIDFDIDTFFGLFPLALTAETMQLVKQKLNHVPVPTRKFFLDTSATGVLGVSGGTYLTSGHMAYLKNNPTSVDFRISVGPLAMNKEDWKTASKLGVSLSGGFNTRGKETEDIDTAVGGYSGIANTAIKKDMLSLLARAPGANKADAIRDLKLRQASLTLVQTKLGVYMLAKKEKSAERKAFMDRLKKLVDLEAGAIREAIMELGRIV